MTPTARRTVLPPQRGHPRLASRREAAILNEEHAINCLVCLQIFFGCVKPLQCVRMLFVYLGLHIGEVYFGNIGSKERLDSRSSARL